MKSRSRVSRVGVLAPAALSACIDASVLAAPAAGAILTTVLKELSKAFMLKKWFYGEMSAREAEQLLMQKGRNGSYLVRESQTRPGEYVLSVRVRRRVSHVKIRRERDKFDVGSGEIFDDLSGLIEHCRAYPLTETSGDVLRLIQPVNGAKNKTASSKTKMETVVEEEVTGSFGLVDMSKELLSLHKMMGAMFLNNTVDYYEDSPKYVVSSPVMIPKEEEYSFIDVEFKSLKEIEKRSNFTTFEGEQVENRAKNRFKNVIPYDQTRVMLPRDSSMNSSNYINASYIKPYYMLKREINDNIMAEFSEPQHGCSSSAASVSEDTSSFNEPLLYTTMPPKHHIIDGVVKDKFYIATQGCLSSTKYDFWLMVANEDIRVIAMVTNEVEQGKMKCSMYWPFRGERESINDIEIHTVNEYAHRSYITREIILTKPDKTKQTVYHYQFQKWPDHGTPLETTSIQRFIRDINVRMLSVQQDKSTAPRQNVLCVHCSAGVGRTGTFIAIAMLIDVLQTQGLDTKLDYYGTVRLLRAQRHGMVHNERQYKFIHKAIADYIEAEKELALNFCNPVQ